MPFESYHEWDVDRSSKPSWNGFPRIKDGAEKAQLGAPRTSTTITLRTSTVFHPRAENRTWALDLPQPSRFYQRFCSLDTVNATTMTTLILCFHSTPPQVTFCWLADVDQVILIFNNARLQLITVQQVRRYLVYIKIQRGKKAKKSHLDQQACCTFPPKLLQRQNAIVFKTRMEKTHMKELRTLKILKW